MLETRRVNCFWLTVNDAATSNFISSVVTDNGRPVLFASYASQMANDKTSRLKKIPIDNFERQDAVDVLRKWRMLLEDLHPAFPHTLGTADRMMGG